jgi:hypothetical protein
MEKFLDVAIERNGAVVAQQSLCVLLLQEKHTAQSKVGKRLPTVARDRRTKEFGCFGVVSSRSSERTQREHIAEALRDRLTDIESRSKVFECDERLVGMQCSVALSVEEGAASNSLSGSRRAADAEQQHIANSPISQTKFQ